VFNGQHATAGQASSGRQFFGLFTDLGRKTSGISFLKTGTFGKHAWHTRRYD